MIFKKKMFFKFPREIGNPSGSPKRKVVYNLERFLQYVNLNNGKIDIHTSVFPFTKIVMTKGWRQPDYKSAIVDKIPTDNDNGEKAWKDCCKIIDFCETENLKLRIHFSGRRGFHTFIAVEDSFLKNKEEAIKGAIRKLKDLKIDLDEDFKGCLAQMVRFPNTFNLKGKKFCIPLTRTQFFKGWDSILELANKQNFKSQLWVTQGKGWDISEFDNEPEKDCEEIKYDTSFEANITHSIDFLPPCIENIKETIKVVQKSFYLRFIFILFLREKGESLRNVIEKLRQILPPQKFYHCVKVERQPQYIFSNSRFMFPSCNRIKKEGLCPGKCSEYGRLLYK